MKAQYNFLASLQLQSHNYFGELQWALYAVSWIANHLPLLCCVSGQTVVKTLTRGKKVVAETPGPSKPYTKSANLFLTPKHWSFRRAKHAVGNFLIRRFTVTTAKSPELHLCISVRKPTVAFPLQLALLELYLVVREMKRLSKLLWFIMPK